MSNLLVPGQPITSEVGFLRGHGTYIVESHNGENGQTIPVLTACVAGEIERMNRLISVRPIKSRYIGEVGDLIVGRVTTVDSKRWKVDIAGQKEAVLQLASVTLPGGAQRIRTYEDQLTMRTLFEENDLVCAEIQNISTEGVISLHTRSLKYGKLENGQLSIVPANLIKRLPQHYVSLPCGMDVIFGKNGFLWITRSIPKDWKTSLGMREDHVTPLPEQLQQLKHQHHTTPLSKEDRLKAARIANGVRLLASEAVPITPDSITLAFNASLDLKIQPKVLYLTTTICLVSSYVIV